MPPYTPVLATLGYVLSAGGECAPLRTRIIGDPHVQNCLAAAAAALACHSAVRFGDVLDMAEQRKLLADLEVAEESVTCPHGRPTRLIVEWQELTRHFRRNY